MSAEQREQDVKNTHERDKRDANQESMDVRELVKTPFGQRYLWKKIDRCGVLKLSMNHSGSQTYFNEGERNIGLGIFIEWFQADPKTLFETMTKNLSNGDKKQ